MSQGNLADFIAAWPGNPTGVSAQSFDCKPGTLVFDTTGGGLYRKTSPIGDNTGYTPVGASKALSEDFASLDTTDQVATLTATGLVRATTGDLLHHTYTPGGNIFGTVALGTQTIAIAVVAAGLDVSGDQTDNDGYEIFTNFAGATGRPFIIGNDPAFYMKVKFTVANVSGLDTLLCGFRRASVNLGTYTDYQDYAALGWNTSAADALIKTLTGLNGTDVGTTTTNTIADTVALTIKVLVSAAGVVTYQHDAVLPGTLAAPTATTAFTFDNGDPVIPFFHFLQGTGADAGAITIQSFEVGFQG